MLIKKYLNLLKNIIIMIEKKIYPIFYLIDFIKKKLLMMQ